MADAFVGEIRAMAIGFAPEGWFLCDGTAYRQADYTLLFAIIGNRYGGSPEKGTFAVPNLVGALPVGVGADGNDLPALQLAEATGTATVALKSSEMPVHTHTLGGKVFPFADAVNEPGDNWLGVPVYKTPNATTKIQQARRYAIGGTAKNVQLHPATLSKHGGNPEAAAEHDNSQPTLTLGYFICWNGEFPVRP
ncbi:phage tail protein [Novispirillum itersonii]|uniref:Microcystin-dependent protein n=1 Tax=Novispirillum itersonii TaxID=189 RepID=A0A7W9ZEZ4_NOVIT|nr:tail fiber protein [Novispirillum itersonii]MBB6210246.1 microcystin-dependent protein [Novispirillum itersonii]